MDINRNIGLTNPNASKECIRLMQYLKEISGKGIIAGQHTQTREQKELQHIQNLTGKLPAICGFELLGYSPNINYNDASEECLIEVRENVGTLENAMDWALNKKGIVTFTWHWFSPLGGRDKSFYAKNTDFDATKVLIEGSPEQSAFFSDMDCIARELKKFEQKSIPILWRPFHEADGTWFWWGSKGPEVAKELWNLMYDRYTHYHHLNNLIWVWNSHLPSGYPGDDTVDIISRDIYLEKYTHTDFSEQYYELIQITSAKKLAALGEVGTMPSASQLEKTRIPWCWFMIWSNEFCLTEQWTKNDELCKAYQSSYVITLDKLPNL